MTLDLTLDEVKALCSSLPKLYTAEQVATEYQINERYVRNEVNAGHLKGIKIANCWHFTAADVQAWITQKQNQSNNQ
jgi:hypothetical protein